MENLFKTLCGALAALIGWVAPIHGLILCAVIFVGIDFVTGVAASSKRSGSFSFESGKAWTTVYKLLFVMGGIVLAWLIDSHILSFMNLKLANLFTGFVCGVEFWSYLENAAEISDHPIFRALKKYMKKKLDAEIGDGISIDEPAKTEDNESN